MIKVVTLIRQACPLYALFMPTNKVGILQTKPELTPLNQIKIRIATNRMHQSCELKNIRHQVGASNRALGAGIFENAISQF